MPLRHFPEGFNEPHHLVVHRLRWMATFGLLVAAAGTMLYTDTAAQRLAESALVLKEVMDAPDKGIPADLLNSATAW